MSVRNYSNKEIEYVVNSFKAYIKLVANHAAMDYARKIRSQKYRIVSMSELIEKEMSLSTFVDDGIFCLDKTLEHDNSNIFTNPLHNKAFNKLTKKEQNVLILYSKNCSVNLISKKLNLTESNVTTIKSRAVNKFKKYLKEG